MDINYLINKYEYIPWNYSPNKNRMPKNYISIDDMEEFNQIYFFARDNYNYVEPCKSGAMPYNNQVRDVQRYMVTTSNTGFELVLCTLQGMFRFLLRNGQLKEGNTISGRKALYELYKKAQEHGVLSVFERLSCSVEEGKKIKEEIESPIVQVLDESYLGKEFTNCWHLDLNSSYASQIVNEYPELKPLYTDLYNKRSENNDLYKHVLTNSIGAMQSRYCLSPKDLFHTEAYALARLSKVAVNGNNEVIRNLLFNLELSGRKPLLINTDGIWYQGPRYSDSSEGLGLGKWKTDAKNCTLYIKSAGAYQYIENGKITTKMRGISRLDMIKPDRETWGWREIDLYDELCIYRFDADKGVYKSWED